MPASRRRVAVAAPLALSLVLGASSAAAQPATPPEEPAAAPDSTPAASPAPAPAPEPEPPAAPAPVDVTVRGDREDGAAVLGRREIRDMPGVMGDPYRAIEIQPGVTPAASGIPYYFVRGAPPGNVGYFLDGVPVPFLFHVGAGPSVVPPQLVSKVDLYLGSYPVSLGRLAGAVVEAETTQPRDEWHGEGVFRMLDAGGVVEGPVGDGVTVLVGGHAPIAAPLLHVIVPAVELRYADYQARAVVARGASRWTALAFGSYDYLTTYEDGKPSVLLDSDFHRLDLRYEHQRASGGKVRGDVLLGLDRSRGLGVRTANDWKVATRVQVAEPVARHVTWRGGAEVGLDAYDIEVSGDPCPVAGCPPGVVRPDDAELEDAFRILFTSRADVAIGAWTDTVLELAPGATLTPGVRVDHYTSEGRTDVGIDPRLVGRFAISDHVALEPAVGVASQPPGFAPIPALVIGGLPGPLQRALQTSFGADVDVMPVSLRATVFRQAIFDLTDAIGSSRGSGFGAERFLQRSTGDAYGLELAVKGALDERTFFYAAYTLSRATRTRDGRTLPSAYDRTHVLHAALMFDLGAGWRTGFRHVFYTGFPADEDSPTHRASEHPPRTLPFYRLDVRLSKRWRVGKTGFIGLLFDMQNVTLAKEVFDVECPPSGCRPRKLGPIAIPGLAIEAGF